MNTVTVAVRKAGRIVDTIERPLRRVPSGLAVVYRRQLWLLKDGRIDIDGPSLTDSDTTMPIMPLAAPAFPKEKRLEAGPREPFMPVRIASVEQATSVDDSAVRLEIIQAPSSARLLVEAGPGTGKTELAARRIANLVRTELSPSQVLVLSFSRSAVRTLTRRLGKLGETDSRILEELRHLSVRTFDSWAFRMLRLLGEDPRTLLARGHDTNIAALTKIASGSRHDELLAKMGDRRHLIVDEFQDLPGVRGDLVLALLDLMAPPDRPGRGFTILGDPAQAIFGFARGKRSDGVSYRTPQQYWQQVCDMYGDRLTQQRLSQNYRADPPLARLSAELRAMLLSNCSEQEKLKAMQAAVAALPAPGYPLGRELLEASTGGSRAILTQTNGEALRVLQTLYGKGTDAAPIPVRLHAGGHAALAPAWIGALLRKLRATSLTQTQFAKIHAHLTGLWGEDTCQKLGLPAVDVAWARIARASGGAEDDTSIDVAELRGRLSWPDAFPDDQQAAEDGIIVTTIHQSKGMEFDIVTMLEHQEKDETAGEDNDEAFGGPGERASVSYVAMTRAARTLDRAAADQIYKAPVHWKFADNRRRLCHWHGKWVNMEMGLRGDIDPIGFVDGSLLGGAAGVENLQSFLLAEAGRLPGRKVMLCKHFADGMAVWHIHLQEGTKPCQLIGRTANQISIDLLNVLHKQGYALPSIIMNLRISHVGTVTADNLNALEEPERTSGLWLGVGLFGTGDFQPRKDKK